MHIAAHELHTYRLPYGRTVRWFNSLEDGGEFVALRLFGEDGARGFAEAPVKPTWGGLSPRALVAVVEDLLLPALAAVDITDQEAVRQALAVFPGNQLAKMVVVNACAVLSAAGAGQSLQAFLGGGADSVEVSWCVTRQSPGAMAAEAAAMVERHGFRCLKLKGGQGFDTDRQVVRAVRGAVGDDVSLTVDANGAYGLDQVRDYLRMNADEGVVLAEDPTGFSADRAFSALVADSPLPLLVDSPCITDQDAAAFIQAGAQAISVKPGRVGFAEATAVIGRACAAGVGVCAGMYAESALGSLLSLAFAATLERPVAPAEQSFYLLMNEQVLGTPLEIVDGTIAIPAMVDLDDVVDWRRIRRG